jgi:saccharopine dehydrogenase-like NADP-dependent oxidoreductase
MRKVAILGAGQIGSALVEMIENFKYKDYDENNDLNHVRCYLIDSDLSALQAAGNFSHILFDIGNSSSEELSKIFRQYEISYVINALPFFLNDMVAIAAADANCSYIDFTEDDVMADKVQDIYKDHPELNCAVKCGLAPGFINYVGYNLVKDLDTADSLMVSVGALPKNVNGTRPQDLYSLSWSVDGLVNEYIRDCRIKKDGRLYDIPALTGREKVIIDGCEYEAAFTSGGIGSLIKDLKSVPNVSYKTLRYPTHYDYVADAVERNHGDFDRIKAEFLKVFPYTRQDVIVVFGVAMGTKKGKKVRNTFSRKFYGAENFTSIQSTTAGGGVAVLELFLSGKIKGIVNHTDISLTDFLNTASFKLYYTSNR